METGSNKAKLLLLDFLKGFGAVIGLSIAIGCLLWAFLFFSGANIRPGESFWLILIFSLLALLFVGLDMAFGLLFSDLGANKSAKIMYFLGGLSAWFVAIQCGPSLINYFEPPEAEETCETIFEKKLGPITLSSEKCDN